LFQSRLRGATPRWSFQRRIAPMTRSRVQASADIKRREADLKSSFRGTVQSNDFARYPCARSRRPAGIKGTANLVGERLSPTTDWRQDSVWYHLDLTDPERPRRPLEPPLELRQGHSVDVPLLEQFPVDTSVATMTRAVVEDRLAEGAILWLGRRGRQAAFRCWNFYATGPLPGGRRGRILLPPEVVMLEDSIANPEFRGRGVAPARGPRSPTTTPSTA